MGVPFFDVSHLLVFLLSSVSAQSQPSARPSPIVELRQYTLHPGQRDVLIDLFEREFIESQEALGMRILGTFRDLDRPDRFVWLRGFSDMPSRADALAAFYGGPVWRTHSKAANATMIDSANVLLLRAAGAEPGSASGSTRAPRGATAIPDGLVVATIYYFDRPAGADFMDFFEHTVRPELRAAGVTIRASFVSETSPNNFPRLPVREHDHVFVWFASFSSQESYERSVQRLAGSAEWQRVAAALRERLTTPPEVLRLQPTARSAMY